ncbi:hypothetical protein METBISCDRAFT_18833 [Metschnikowia bicuspidata]|uniref:Sister chromatid cohesion protein DCC1 n=1 Tax=Metschnikowia bicuspidata TaxID=27322 RepID=A0A4P9ZAM7_9ASCO|nr:hypothetical protein METBISCDRAFT_18833 [Metschnikowia bicuspidata]
MSFSVYKETSPPDGHIYKLMQLPKELLDYIKTSRNVLEFKSPALGRNHLVLCTESNTYTVRQMNHSNTQLLVEDLLEPRIGKSLLNTFGLSELESSNNLLVVGLCSYLYELTPTQGDIEIAGLQVYDGTEALLSVKTCKKFAELVNDSPIAARSFQKRWHQLCGSTVNDQAVILAPDFVCDALYALVSVTIAEELNVFTLDAMTTRMVRENRKFTPSVVETICGKFCDPDDNRLTLNQAAIAKWFGVATLRKLRGVSTDKDLLLQWKSSLPPFFNALLNLKSLRGHYYRPLLGAILHLDRAGLSTDIHGRIKEMFLLVKKWDYDEFLPYVDEFIPATKKADSVILKYAKKKRAGKSFFVCPR